MAVNYKVEWPMSLGAARDSLEAKQPDIDNGLDVVDPSRYYSREFMQREWQSLWPRVWLLAGVASAMTGGIVSVGGVSALVAVKDLTSLKPWFPA